MLVQALADFADTQLSEQLSDESFESKPVAYYLEIDREGAFVTIRTNTAAVMRGKKVVSAPVSINVPKSPVPRNAGLYPLLAADDIKYVLGPGPWTAKGQEANNQERHDAFVSLLRDAAAQTKDESLRACVAFYEHPDQVEAARQQLASAKPGDMVALSVLLDLVIHQPAVCAFWSAHYRKAAGERIAKGGDAECLISGVVGPIAPTHDKIKGLASLGGQSSGVALMSFDKDAYRSYGWEQNANSPVSQNRANAYVLAFNHLLRPGGKHRRDVAGVGFIFWTRKESEFDIFNILDAPDEQQVDRLLSLKPDADPDPNMFYMAGLGATGGRMIVRYWVSETLAQAKTNIHDWFAGLRIINFFTGKAADPPRLWQLLCAIDREGEPPADRTIAFIRRATEGSQQPLGYRMLSAALNRHRLSSSSERLKNAARLGLIRLCINDLAFTNKGNDRMNEGLDLQNTNPAYLCGRLLAVYESIQRAAHRLDSATDLNKTVVDRYYSLASAYPALAFHNLDMLSEKHLQKLNRRGHRGKRYQLAVDGIMERLSSKFPESLDLMDQGRFVLGYHHQRAYQRTQALAYKAKKLNSSPINNQEQP